MTLGCLGALDLGVDYTWTEDDASDLWAEELNWLPACLLPPPGEPCPPNGYPDDATNDARIIWGLEPSDQPLTIDLSTETIDQLFVSVDQSTGFILFVEFTSEDPGGNTLTCDNIVLNPINEKLRLTVKDGAELKTVD